MTEEKQRVRCSLHCACRPGAAQAGGHRLAGGGDPRRLKERLWGKGARAAFPTNGEWAKRISDSSSWSRWRARVFVKA